ncbi:MAG: nucleotide exchange factor GrpE [Rhodospirillaceae bacterium]|nr:nucleotide exchange factor GrpE [Rhodospirillaceae bacterium]
MTDDPRKSDSADDPPDSGTGADDPEAPGDAPATASAPPKPANDSEAAADSDPATADSKPDAADTAAGDAESAEPNASLQESEAGPPALTAEEQRIVDLETEVAELKDRALRALADAANARKRAARDVADSRKYGATGLARDILSVADNLGRALEAVPEIPREEDENLFNLRAGVDMTLQEMLQALERHGVKKVTPETGERFDHNRHQAMFEVPTDELAPGAVAQVVQDGYVIHDRLLRPALVGVARKPPEEPAPEAGPDAGKTAEEAAEAPEDAAEPPEENAGESDAA